MRTKDPVYRDRRFLGWILTRYDDVATVLREPGSLVSCKQEEHTHRAELAVIKDVWDTSRPSRTAPVGELTFDHRRDTEQNTLPPLDWYAR